MKRIFLLTIILLSIESSINAQSLSKDEAMKILVKKNQSEKVLNTAMDMNLLLEEVDQANTLKGKMVKDDIIIYVIQNRIKLKESDINDIVGYMGKGYSSSVIIKSISGLEKFNLISPSVATEPDLIEFLTKIKTLVEQHNWDEFTTHYATELNEWFNKEIKNGRDNAIQHFISENLGAMFGNEFKVNQIEEINFVTSSINKRDNETSIEISGTIRLKDNTKKKLNLIVVKELNMSWKISGAVG